VCHRALPSRAPAFRDARRDCEPSLPFRLPSLHLRLPSTDRAPVLVISDGHAAFDTDPHALRGLCGVRREEALEKRHSGSPGCVERRPPYGGRVDRVPSVPQPIRRRAGGRLLDQRIRKRVGRRVTARTGYLWRREARRRRVQRIMCAVEGCPSKFALQSGFDRAGDQPNDSGQTQDPHEERDNSGGSAPGRRGRRGSRGCSSRCGIHRRRSYIWIAR
jgi:hypothetical protein